MKYLMRLLLSIALLGALIAGLYLFFKLTEDPVHRDRLLQFERIKAGMTQTEVTALFGHPTSRETTFRLAQRKRFETEYDRANARRSHEWWLWESGDFVFAVGFSADKRVTVTSCGGT
jgi:hypothetical protein